MSAFRPLAEVRERATLVRYVPYPDIRTGGEAASNGCGSAFPAFLAEAINQMAEVVVVGPWRKIESVLNREIRNAV